MCDYISTYPINSKPIHIKLPDGGREAVPKFHAGDIVRLRSGGPHMTYGSMAVNSVHACYWFDDADHAHRDYFPDASLIKA